MRIMIRMNHHKDIDKLLKTVIFQKPWFLKKWHRFKKNVCQVLSDVSFGHCVGPTRYLGQLPLVGLIINWWKNTVFHHDEIPRRGSLLGLPWSYVASTLWWSFWSSYLTKNVQENFFKFWQNFLSNFWSFWKLQKGLFFLRNHRLWFRP